MRSIAVRFVVVVAMVLGIAAAVATPALADPPPRPYHSVDDQVPC